MRTVIGITALAIEDRLIFVLSQVLTRSKTSSQALTTDAELKTTTSRQNVDYREVVQLVNQTVFARQRVTLESILRSLYCSF